MYKTIKCYLKSCLQVPWELSYGVISLRKKQFIHTEVECGFCQRIILIQHSACLSKEKVDVRVLDSLERSGECIMHRRRKSHGTLHKEFTFEYFVGNTVSK